MYLEGIENVYEVLFKFICDLFLFESIKRKIETIHIQFYERNLRFWLMFITFSYIFLCPGKPQQLTLGLNSFSHSKVE